MGRRIVLRPEAEADLLQARDWYEQDGSELAEAFADSFEEMIGRIEAMPELYAVALKNIRRGKLRRFPYLVGRYGGLTQYLKGMMSLVN